MPFLSLVVPVHGVQGFLGECLDSILTQPFADLEVIAVDDASPDHCGEILDSYAERDPRVRVIHLESNVGLGPARNVGLDEALGEYVWFVDSDDWLAAGALPAIARAARAASPDLILVDHTRADWFGRHRPSDSGPVLARVAAAGAVSLAAEPGLLDLFTVVWNKVVRRDFLVRTGIRFDIGWYEDLPFTHPVLIAADRIAAVDRVCYHYRQRRTDAITRTRSARHTEVFDQWTRVFDRLDAMGERATPYRAAVAERMRWHLLVVLSRPDRVPPRLRRDFFRRTSLLQHRYQVGPRPASEASDRLRHALIAANAYLAFQILRLLRHGLDSVRRRARTALRRSRGGARALVGATRTLLGHGWYHLQRRLPMDQRLAVYAAYWYRGFGCNPAAIYASARELIPSVRGVWVVERGGQDAMPPQVPYVVAGTAAYYRALARARWLINNVNFPDFVVKRPGSVHVQTHHGTPVKVMGLDQAAFPISAQGMDFAALLRRSDRWDYSLSANAHSTQVWSRAYPCSYEALELGYPRNDRLALAEPDEIAAARAELDAGERTVVLYAPTFRDYLPGRPALLDPEQVADALGEQVLLLLRYHYFDDDTPAADHPRVRDVSAHPRVEDLLLAADVLITDYSSLMFDYAVLDRPIVIFAPDWDAYRRTRGVTFDLLAEPPGVVATDQAALIDAFGTQEVFGEAAAKARAQFRERFCYLDDGRAADRVVRRVFGRTPRRPGIVVGSRLGG